MPLALDPNEIFEIVLESDKDRPRENQPRFLYKFLTGREWRGIAKFDEHLEELRQNKTSADEVVDYIFETAATGLVGWVNMFNLGGGAIPFDIEKFEDIVTMPEAQEIVSKLQFQRPSWLDKKKLDSQSDSDTAESAKGVEE